MEKLGGLWLEAVVDDVIFASVVLGEEPAAIVDAGVLAATVLDQHRAYVVVRV